MKKEDLEKLCHDFYKDIYKYKDITEETLMKVIKRFPIMFTEVMDVSLVKEINKNYISQPML